MTDQTAGLAAKTSLRRKPCCPRPSRRSAPSTSAACCVRKALLDQRAQVRARRDRPGGADRRRGPGHQGRARAAGARRPEVRDRRRIPPPLLPQLLLPPARRRQHRHRRRRGRQGRHARQARLAAGRHDQEPRALDPPDQRRRTSTSSAPTPGSCRRSPFPAPARCTSAAATPPCWRRAYQDLDQFWDDTVEAFGQELQALADAGCRYVQIDETAFAKFGDPEVQAQLKARGDDWSALIDKYVAVTNRVLKNAPAGMQIGMHLCRGNRGGQWHAEGSYDSVADRLFNALNIPFYFLEYDSPARRHVHAAAPRAAPQDRGARPRLDQDAGDGEQGRAARSASRTRRAISISTVSRSARNAASPASTPATRSRRRCRSRSSGWWSSWRATSGARREQSMRRKATKHAARNSRL